MWSAIGAIVALVTLVVGWLLKGRYSTKGQIARLENGLQKLKDKHTQHISGQCILSAAEYDELREQIADVAARLRAIRATSGAN